VELEEEIFPTKAQAFDLAVGSWCSSPSSRSAEFPTNVAQIFDENVCPSENTGLGCSVHEFVKPAWYFSLGSFLGDTRNKEKIDTICKNHDLCYRSYAIYRSDCDKRFRSDRVDHCRRRFKTVAEYNFRLVCEGVALSSYEQVTLNANIFDYRQKQAFARLATCGLEFKTMPFNPLDAWISKERVLSRMLEDTQSNKKVQDFLENPLYQSSSWREDLALNLLTCIEPE